MPCAAVADRWVALQAGQVGKEVELPRGEIEGTAAEGGLAVDEVKVKASHAEFCRVPGVALGAAMTTPTTTGTTRTSAVVARQTLLRGAGQELCHLLRPANWKLAPGSHAGRYGVRRPAV
ncbi:MAG: hypothetical protein ABSF03_01875 [Streptosporangiaceae bacterium]